MSLKISNSTQKRKLKLLTMSLVGLGAVVGLGAAVAGTAFATTGATFVVDADGHATAGNCNSSTVTPYTTVTAGIAAASAGDTVKVCPGSYAENVVVNKALTLKGAGANHGVGSRTFGSAGESTITGLVTVQAADVKVTGFSLTNPGQGLGVLVKSTGNNAVISRNFVKTVGSVSLADNAVGIYLELGPDNVQIKGNSISDIKCQTGSAQGVLVGDSTSTNPSLNTRIDNNKFSDIASVNKGAYGIQLNNGVHATGYTEAKIRGNKISNLSGNWVHAVGLEGPTPNVVVDNNTISNLTDPTPTLGSVVGVFFEDNVFFWTGDVNQNSLDVGADNFGILVAPALTSQYVSLNVDGTCNWWGAKSGPSSLGTGTGSHVSAGVDFQPFLHNSNINWDCNDKFSHNGHHNSHHDWSDRDADDWRHDD